MTADLLTMPVAPPEWRHSGPYLVIALALHALVLVLTPSLLPKKPGVPPAQTMTVAFEQPATLTVPLAPPLPPAAVAPKAPPAPDRPRQTPVPRRAVLAVVAKTNPLTNYNALVVDQNLRNNSFVSLMNTNVYRLGEDYDANVTGAFFNIKTKDQKYFIGGSGVLSQKLYNETTERGHTYNFALGKISGNWTYEAGHGVESDKYDPNDMGFLLSPNEQYYYIEGGHTQYKPKNEKLQQVRFSASSVYSRLYKPDVFTDFNIELESFILYKSRFAVGFNTRLEPVRTFDYFESRTGDFSRFMTWPTNYTAGCFISSDYRKPFAYDIRLSYRYFDADQRNNTNIVLAPRFRFSDQLSIFTSTTLSIINFEPGYVNKNLADSPISGLGENDILFGNRNRFIIENSITGRFIFNAIMGINLRVRHYWDKVRYQEFGRLYDDGYVAVTPYKGLNEKDEPIFDTKR